MGLKVNVYTDTFICMCGSLDHQFVFQIYDYGDEDDKIRCSDPDEWVLCSLSVFLPDVGFWQRLRRGLGYIFGRKSRFGHWDSADIKDADAERLMAGLARFRQVVDNYRKPAPSLPEGPQSDTVASR